MSGLVLIEAGVGALVALYALTTVCIAHRFTTARRIRPDAPPESNTLPRFERVSFTARHETLRLAAWYAGVPSATRAVVLVHGRDACRGGELRGQTFELVQRLRRDGFSVLLLDLRGHGESATGRLTFGKRERRDVLGAVDFLLARGYAATQIGVLGASMGGVSAIAAAAEEPAIGALVTDSAFCDFEDVLRRQFVRLTRLPMCCLTGAVAVARVLTGEHLLRHSVAPAMRRLAGIPTFVIHAAHDPFVPVAHAHRLASLAAGTLWITNGTRHLASYGAAREEYLDRVSRFFAEHLASHTPVAISTTNVSVLPTSLTTSRHTLGVA